MKLRVVVWLLVMAAELANGQSFRGAIFGKVVDRKGARLAEANVRVTNVDTGLRRETITAGDGQFGLSELPLGTYDLTVTKAGFRMITVSAITVALTNPVRADVEMTQGEAARLIQVPAAVPAVSTRSNTLGGSWRGEILQLPVNGRDFKKLLSDVPGAAADSSLVDEAPGSFGVVAVNGNRGRSNDFLLDGGDINDSFHNRPTFAEGGAFSIPGTLLPLSSIAELAVANNTNAEYGRNAGSLVNLVTKSGTDDLHGTFFEYFRNSRLDARNYFNFRSNPFSGLFERKDVLQNNQFGASLGGAAIPGKTFWFFAYEGQRERAGVPSLAKVPSQEQIAAASHNPIVQNILNLNPWGLLPQFGDGGRGSNTAATIEPETRASNRVDTATGKLDHHWARNVLSARYSFADGRQIAPVAIAGGDMLPGYNTVAPTRVHDVTASLTHVISPRALLELRVGWGRVRQSATPEDKDLNPAMLGLNVGNQDFTFADYGLPLITVHGFSPLGANRMDSAGRVDGNMQYTTNFSIDEGRNAYKIGFEFRHSSVREYFDKDHRGSLAFPSLAAFLAGVAGSGTQSLGDSHRNLDQNNYALYIQDSYRYSEKLTLNYGLRWEYFGVIGEKNNLLSIFSPSFGLEQVRTNGGPATLYPKDEKAVAPRVGVIYDLTGKSKTLVRAGWGVFYDQFSQDLFAGQIGLDTSNAGPVFNGIGAHPILYGTIDPLALMLTAAPCGTNQIPVPGTGSCTGPIFSGFSASQVFSVAPHLSTPYIQNYNANIEQQLGSKMVLAIGYVGSSGRKLFRYRDINQANPLTGIRPFDSGPFTPPAGISPGGAPFGHVDQLESQASSTFNSLQASLATTNLHGLATRLNYTYSHSIDNASDGLNYAPDQAMPDNSFNPAAERSSSAFDMRQHFTWSFSYSIPGSHLLPQLTSGWELAGLASLMTGLPFTVNDLGNFNGSGEFLERPDLVGNPFAGVSTPFSFLNLSAFAAPCSAPNAAGESCSLGAHFGSSRRNQFRGPHFRNFDLGISKESKIGERARIELRADVFNIFNHPNLANPLWPASLVDWTRNGVDPASGRGLGFLPLTVTPDVGAQNPYIGAGGPRNFQLALRLIF